MPLQSHTVGELMTREFAGLPISRPFGTLCGDVWPGFQILLWGPKGEGKSTAALILLAALQPYATADGGVCWYVSGEEGVGPGLQLRAERTGITQEALSDIVLSGYGPMSRKEFQQEITQRDARWVVIDSVQTLGFSGTEIWKFLDWARENGVGIVLIAHAKKDAQDYKGDSALAHWVDCVIQVYREDGTHYGQTEKSRALDQVPTRQRLPASVSDLGPGPSPALVERAARANPSIDCTNWPNKEKAIQQQCKAIFASYDNLTEEDTADDEEEAQEAPETPETDERETEEAEDGDEDEDVSEAAARFEGMSTEDILSELSQMMEAATK